GDPGLRAARDHRGRRRPAQPGPQPHARADDRLRGRTAGRRRAGMTVTRAHSLRLLLLLGFALGAGAIFVALLRLGGGLDLGAKYHVEAVVPSAVQLVPQADVKLAGVTIGKVDKIDTRGSTAVLDLVIDRDK